MANLESIRFQKISTVRFSAEDKLDLIAELKKRKITIRVTAQAILFDERFLKDVKDIVPASLR